MVADRNLWILWVWFVRIKPSGGKSRTKKRGAWKITGASLMINQFVWYLRDHLLLGTAADITIIKPFVETCN
jgi:hypothetical protein